MTVEIGDSDHEPDAVVHCGAKLPGDAITVPNPLIIAEVLSPGASSSDRTWKLVEYFFRLPSAHHYLAIWPDKQQVVHHRRDDARGVIDTQVFTSGQISLDPPSLTITVEDIY
jgi:Uma2 family endonuclease